MKLFPMGEGSIIHVVGNQYNCIPGDSGLELHKFMKRLLEDVPRAAFDPVAVLTTHRSRID